MTKGVLRYSFNRKNSTDDFITNYTLLHSATVAIETVMYVFPQSANVNDDVLG